MNMSARAFDRILKVARTIAYLEGCADVLTHYNRGAHQPTATSTAPLIWVLQCKSLNTLSITIISINLCFFKVFADFFCRHGEYIYLCANNLIKYSMILNLVI